MRFFLSYRFWLPLLLILGLEFAFELGFYEPFVKRDSHSGTSIKMGRAMKELGYKNIDYVTLGDSRADLALNHRMIFDSALQSGRRHVSMAMPGSHFTTFQTASEFLHTHIPNVKGVLFVVSSSTMTRLFNGYYELGIIQPFRRPADFGHVLKTIHLKISDVETYGAVSSLFQYQEDIKDLLSNPGNRMGAVFKKGPNWRDILAHGEWSDLDMCSLDLDSPDTCSNSVEKAVQSGTQISAEGLNHLRRVKTVCTTYGTKMNLPMWGEVTKVKDSWTELIRSLRFEKKPVVVLLPDSRFIEKYHFPPGTRS